MRSSRRPTRQWGSQQNLDMFGNVEAVMPVSAPIVIPGASPESAVPVASLTETARAVVEGALPPLWVRGEVSDFKRHRNGHWYFCLRDATAQVRCVVWSRGQRLIPTSPDDGMEVTAYGQLTVYPARGDLHLNVTAMEARGDGLWRKALEETRLRLDRDGLLAPERKRALPTAPLRVGVVTSPDGAALRDVIAVIRRRAPHITIALSATAVQGTAAPAQICAAIERVCRWGRADVLIIGRGGGAREDLWAFNDELVARAIAAASVPVISGVGHEIDITIADLVADYRAATPSAAAEAAVPVRADMFAALAAAGEALRDAMLRRAAFARGDLENAAEILRRTAELDAKRRRARMANVAGRLNVLSPLPTLARGYAVARDVSDRRTLAQVADFDPDRLFTLTLRDGDIVARPVK
ncbi:MAG: exodeoxyribonuclease VII large subunit [Gemmatimonadaceae bacterium]